MEAYAKLFVKGQLLAGSQGATPGRGSEYTDGISSTAQRLKVGTQARTLGQCTSAIDPTHSLSFVVRESRLKTPSRTMLQNCPTIATYLLLYMPRQMQRRTLNTVCKQLHCTIFTGFVTCNVHDSNCLNDQCCEPNPLQNVYINDF